MNVLSVNKRAVGGPAGMPDIAVVGAGSAGFSAAIRAAELGASVALIGHGTIGGTCVNVGCVPSKALIRAAEALHGAQSARRFSGIEGWAALTDWKALIAQKDELVRSLRQAKYADLLPGYSRIRYIESKARLTDDGVSVDGQLYRPGKTIIATGASPAVPPIPGLADVPYLTSTSAMALESLPKSLVILGGGFVGCELGQFFARAGATVTILCRSRLLPEEEPEIGVALAGYLREEGITVRCGITYGAVRSTTEGVAVVIHDDRGEAAVVEAERLLVATGRTPNTEGLGLEAVKIDRAPGGGIAVDDRLRTSRAGVYAAGDVIGRHMFVYMAAYAAKLAAENALRGDARRYDATAMPAVTFTDPQVATVGLTEAKARAAGYDARTVTLPLDQVPRALAARDARGLIKLVADRKDGRLLGAHILAPEGGDSIQTAALAIKQRLTVADLADTIFPYLTTVEGLKLAALGFTKDVAKLSCCAG